MQVSTPDPTITSAEDPRDAGTILRETREAAGLSLDMVSQQLKLAPRQVKALEDGEFELLPGRTFVRGFARNYARLLQLDPEAIVNALPGAAGSGLDAPPLNPTAVTMGELPSTGRGRAGGLRWGFLALAIVIIAGAAAYAFWQNRLQRGSTAPAEKAPAVQLAPPAAPAPAPVATPTPVPAPTAAPDAGTLLPNSGIGAPLDSGEATQPAGAPAEPAATPGGAAAAPINLLVRGASWVEIKDASGRAVISQTVQAGQSPAIVGSPPFDVVIGNAPDVTLTYRGQPVDLAPFTRGSVARFTLK